MSFTGFAHSKINLYLKFTVIIMLKEITPQAVTEQECLTQQG